MDDRDGLENRCGGDSTVGSNPTPPAIDDPTNQLAWRGSIVRPNAHAWRACEQKCSVGSNPTLSAIRDPNRGIPLRLPLFRFDFLPFMGYHINGRARRGASGALYPQSAIAGSNSPSRVSVFQDCRG